MGSRFWRVAIPLQKIHHLSAAHVVAMFGQSPMASRMIVRGLCEFPKSYFVF